MRTAKSKNVSMTRLGVQLLSSVAALLAAWAPTVRAEPQDSNLLTDTFYLSLGTFVVGTDTKVRVNGKDRLGDKIDVERTFGDSDASRFRVDGYWRFADRHKLRFLWFDWNYRANRKLEEDIDFAGEIYPIGAKAQLERGATIYELAYEYAFLRRQKFELSGTFGVHYTEISTRLKAQVTVDGESLDPLSLRNTARVDAPLPVLGLRGLWHVRGDWWLDASGQYFALAIDEYDGSLQDYRVAVVWQPRRYAGVGIGYNAFRVSVKLDKRDFDGSLDWAYYGPQVFFSASF
jgi:hypothetical protein